MNRLFTTRPFLILAILVWYMAMRISAVNAEVSDQEFDGRDIKAVTNCSEVETENLLRLLTVNSGWSEKRWGAFRALTRCYDAKILSERTLVRLQSAVKEVSYEFPKLGLIVTYIHGSSLSTSQHALRGTNSASRIITPECEAEKKALQSRLQLADHCFEDSDCKRISLIGLSCSFKCEAIIKHDLVAELLSEIQRHERNCPTICDFKCPATKDVPLVCRMGRCVEGREGIASPKKPAP